MKKFLLVLSMLLVASTASAQWNHHHRHSYPRTVVVERNDWIAPLIIGGIAGVVIANANQPQPVIVQPQPIIVQREPVIVQREPVCTAWKEIQMPDGQIYRERSCY